MCINEKSVNLWYIHKTEYDMAIESKCVFQKELAPFVQRAK